MHEAIGWEVLGSVGGSPLCSGTLQTSTTHKKKKENKIIVNQLGFHSV